MKFVIPSKGRSNSVCSKSLKLIPDAIVCVEESEFAEYSKVIPKTKLLVHPDNVVGIGPLRNWIIENVADETVIMLDDDIDCVYDQTHYLKIRIENPLQVMAILERTCIASKEAGAKIFGYSQAARPLAYMPFAPIAFDTWVGGVVGVHGKNTKWDKELLLRADIDACLKSLLKDRITWVDGRYCFVHKRFVGNGGNNTLRTMSRHQAEIEKLKHRWGKYLVEKKELQAVRLVLKIRR
jgi:hypothetical protein